jgi:hypothetical protein
MVSEGMVAFNGTFVLAHSRSAFDLLHVCDRPAESCWWPRRNDCLLPDARGFPSAAALCWRPVARGGKYEEGTVAVPVW